MAKGHMAEAWERYLNKVMPPSASETQVDETRKAFYSGAAALLAQIMLYLGPDEEPTDADMAMMDAIHEELVAFARSQRDVATCPKCGILNPLIIGGRCQSCEAIAERAARVRAGESEGKPADEVFERLAAKENPPNPCGHSGQALDERCDKCDPPLCSQCHQPLPHHKMDCSLRSADLKP